MNTSARTMIRVGLGGGAGGAVNAWLCYARLPVPVKDDPRFAWHVIPAGAAHGALLAALAIGLGGLLSRFTLRRRLVAALPVAWLAGFAAWIPLNRSVFGEPWPRSLTWPFHGGVGNALLSPLQFFGFVALVYYGAVALRLDRARRLAAQVALAGVAGVLGSLWWWIEFQPWYFAIIHGAIWGALVGLGAWASRRDANAGRGA